MRYCRASFDYRTRWRAFAAFLLACGALACDTSDEPVEQADGTAASAAATPAVVDPEVARQARSAFEDRMSQVEAALKSLPGLIGSIRRDMRRHLNSDHVAAARRNGVGPVRDSAHAAALARSGALVQLPDSTRWWVVRELDHSLPYVTPGTHAALEEIGRRFHARLEERGLPPFRFEITSVLRTAGQQAAMRQRNRNAARTTSSHEFGTTLDLAYHSFASPATIEERPWEDVGGTAPPDQLNGAIRHEAEARLDSLATSYANHLEGELGAVLQELLREGRVLPLRERSQPVFHITVAK